MECSLVGGHAIDRAPIYYQIDCFWIVRPPIASQLPLPPEISARPSGSYAEKSTPIAGVPGRGIANGRRRLLCRFSDAGIPRPSTRSGGRRPKSAKARNRGWVGHGAAACSMAIWPRLGARRGWGEAVDAIALRQGMGAGARVTWRIARSATRLARARRQDWPSMESLTPC
jgi:hypothetical protein